MASKVIAFESGRRITRAQEYQRVKGGNNSHIEREVVLRWQKRQSIETIARRMELGTLYVQRVLRDRFAILPSDPAQRRAA